MLKLENMVRILPFMRDKTEYDTFLVLKGMTVDEMIEFVDHIDLSGLNTLEIQEKMDPILGLYGWSVEKIFEAKRAAKSANE